MASERRDAFENAEQRIQQMTNKPRCEYCGVVCTGKEDTYYKHCPHLFYCIDHAPCAQPQCIECD